MIAQLQHLRKPLDLTCAVLAGFEGVTVFIVSPRIDWRVVQAHPLVKSKTVQQLNQLRNAISVVLVDVTSHNDLERHIGTARNGDQICYYTLERTTSRFGEAPAVVGQSRTVDSDLYTTDPVIVL